MAMCNMSSLPQSPKLLYSLFMLAPFFFSFFSYANPLSFNFPSLGPNNTDGIITFMGNASISNDGIQLTRDPDVNSLISGWNAGRATYVEPLHLWEEGSGKLTDFATHFSFIIKKANDRDLGEGLTFFLVPNGSGMPPDAAGGRLGVESQRLRANHFVAVEFDTYRNNEWEANLAFNHIAILINSMSSVANISWDSNFVYERIHDAWINYDSRKKNLGVVFTRFDVDGNPQEQNGLYYIVDLKDYLPAWVNFGFSAATGEAYEKNNIKSWQFSSTIPGRGDKVNIGLVVGLTVGSFVLLCGLALFGFCLWRKLTRVKKDVEPPMDDEFEKGSGPKKFSYRELARATNNFSEKEKLGEGGFGAVFKGFLREFNSYVAIKKISRGSKQGINEFASEVNIISRLRHRNLVQLKGWSHEKRELLLVYEFMANGSLDLHLFKEDPVLTWSVRYKIAKGLASALLYLHGEWEQCVLHRDLKPSNVMLDLDFNAKLGDFGLAKLVDHENGLPSTTELAGTMGYMAIEYVFTRKASKESDVYSFGIVCLEIGCGRKPNDFSAQGIDMTIVEWVWSLYGTGNILEAADHRLSRVFDEQEMEHLLVVGLWCANPDYNLRPSIRQATLVLNFESPLPTLPSKIPSVPKSFGPPPSVNYMTASSLTSSDGSNIMSKSSESPVDRTQAKETRTAFSYNDKASSNSSTALPSSAPPLYTI